MTEVAASFAAGLAGKPRPGDFVSMSDVSRNLRAANRAFFAEHVDLEIHRVLTSAMPSFFVVRYGGPGIGPSIEALNVSDLVPYQKCTVKGLLWFRLVPNAGMFNPRVEEAFTRLCIRRSDAIQLFGSESTGSEQAQAEADAAAVEAAWATLRDRAKGDRWSEDSDRALVTIWSRTVGGVGDKKQAIAARLQMTDRALHAVLKRLGCVGVTVVSSFSQSSLQQLMKPEAG